jgi:hypothetical protein
MNTKLNQHTSNTTPVVAAILDDETLKALGAERMSGAAS